MDRISVFARYSRQGRCAGLLLSIASTASFAHERCKQLEDLNRQYAGVELTSSQKQIKQQMVAWYRQNCGRARTANALLANHCCKIKEKAPATPGLFV